MQENGSRPPPSWCWSSRRSRGSPAGDAARGTGPGGAPWKADRQSSAARERQLRAEFTPNDRIRIELGGPFSYPGVGGVTGFDDRQRGAFNGVDFELRYRLFDRAHAPFALTFGAEPQD